MPLHGKLRDKFGDVIIERNLAALDQLHHRNPRKRQHRPDDVIHRLVLSRGLQPQVREAIPAMQQYFAALHHQHRGPGNAFLRNHPPRNRIQVRGSSPLRTTLLRAHTRDKRH